MSQPDMGGAETMTTNRMELTKALSFATMGDGGVYYGGKNCYFAMNILEKNRDYAELIQKLIEDNLTSCRIKVVEKEPPRQTQVNLLSKTHPFFTTLRERIYVGLYKSVDVHALKCLDYEALSFLYMSDGSFCKDKRTKSGEAGRKITLNMKRLSYGDQFLLKKALKEKLNLEWNIHKNSHRYYLALRAKDVDTFLEGISPFVCPSFSYKLSCV